MTNHPASLETGLGLRPPHFFNSYFCPGLQCCQKKYASEFWRIHWYSGRRGFHVYLALSNFSNLTPNTWYTKYTFFMCFSKIRRNEKRVFGVEQSLPIKLRVIGVFGKSKSCLGLGYTEACGTIRCHLKNFWCFLLEHFPSFFSVSQ